MRDQYAEDLSEATEENARLQDRVADLEAELQELRTAFDGAAGEIEALAERFDVAVDVEAPTDGGEQNHALRERVDELEAENHRLRSQVDVEISETLQNYEDFLELDVVQEEIEAAKEESTPKYVKGVLAAIVNEGKPVSYETVAQRLGLSQTNHVSAAATELETRRIVEKEKINGETHVDLNTDGIETIRRAAAEREKTEQLMDEF